MCDKDRDTLEEYDCERLSKGDIIFATLLALVLICTCLFWIETAFVDCKPTTPPLDHLTDIIQRPANDDL